jgi:hypothetical protein
MIARAKVGDNHSTVPTAEDVIEWMFDMRLIDNIPVWGPPEEGALNQIKTCAKTADKVALMPPFCSICQDKQKRSKPNWLRNLVQEIRTSDSLAREKLVRLRAIQN